MNEFFCLVSEIGSSRVKSAVFDSSGKIISSCSECVSFEYDGIRAEADPELWASALFKTMQEAIKNSNVNSLEAICVCSLGPAEVFLDSSFNPVRKSIIWLDSRAKEESAVLNQMTGRHFPPSFTAPVSMWVKNHEHDIFRKIAYIMQPLDYASLLLTGVPSFSMLSDSFTPFALDMWKAAKLPDSIIPDVIKTGEKIGTLSKTSADLLGISTGIPVYAGTGGADVAETILGMGCLEETIVGNKTGTSEGIEIISDFQISDSRFFTAPHPFLEGKWHIGAAMTSGGGTLDWFRKNFYGDIVKFDDMILDALKSKSGCDGLVFLPYIAGERCPVADPDARGVFFGISKTHERHDMLRAVMEGVAYGIREILDIFETYSIKPSLIRTSGLPSSIDLWNRIKADITGIPVQPSLCKEPDLLGIAAIAMKGAGIFGSFKEASDNLTSFGPIVLPSTDNKKIYDRNYSIYKELYPSLNRLFSGK